MSNEEDRAALARILNQHDPEGGCYMDDPDGNLDVSWWYPQADAILAAGYRRYPEPEVTYEMVIQAVGAYEDDSDERVYWRSMRAALEAALGVDDR